jgi:hypothetical protein
MRSKIQNGMTMSQVLRLGSWNSARASNFDRGLDEARATFLQFKRSNHSFAIVLDSAEPRVFRNDAEFDHALAELVAEKPGPWKVTFWFLGVSPRPIAYSISLDQTAKVANVSDWHFMD